MTVELKHMATVLSRSYRSLHKSDEMQAELECFVRAGCYTRQEMDAYFVRILSSHLRNGVPVDAMEACANAIEACVEFSLMGAPWHETAGAMLSAMAGDPLLKRSSYRVVFNKRAKAAIILDALRNGPKTTTELCMAVYGRKGDCEVGGSDRSNLLTTMRKHCGGRVEKLSRGLYGLKSK